MNWDVQLSLVTHECGGGRASPAVSVSLWDNCEADASAGSEAVRGISLEVQGMTVTLGSAPQKPLHIESAVSGVPILALLLLPTGIGQGGKRSLHRAWCSEPLW